jgi:hypothetical protein
MTFLTGLQIVALADPQQSLPVSKQVDDCGW